jgi:hypothetical protein
MDLNLILVNFSHFEFYELILHITSVSEDMSIDITRYRVKSKDHFVLFVVVTFRVIIVKKRVTRPNQTTIRYITAFKAYVNTSEVMPYQIEKELQQ